MMGNQLPVLSSVLYGSEEPKPKPDGARQVPTLKSMLAPQTVPLFTIHYDLIRKRPYANKNHNVL
jgi:hypothetical protein